MQKSIFFSFFETFFILRKEKRSPEVKDSVFPVRHIFQQQELLRA